MSQRGQSKLVIGWREYVDLPEWHIRGLKAKVDTGARTSALHVDDIEELPHNHIEFYVVLSRKNSNRRIRVRTKALKRGRVKASHGTRTTRWYVQTKIKIGPVEKKIELNLVDRSEMIFRMLLGRRALEDKFLVDVDHSYCLGKNKRKIK
jgi:hypothetical protein